MSRELCKHREISRCLSYRSVLAGTPSGRVHKKLVPLASSNFPKRTERCRPCYIHTHGCDFSCAASSRLQATSKRAISANVTDHGDLALRQHLLPPVGRNGRLDSLKAARLSVRCCCLGRAGDMHSNGSESHTLNIRTQTSRALSDKNRSKPRPVHQAVAGRL